METKPKSDVELRKERIDKTIESMKQCLRNQEIGNLDKFPDDGQQSVIDNFGEIIHNVGDRWRIKRTRELLNAILCA